MTADPRLLSDAELAALGKDFGGDSFLPFGSRVITVRDLLDHIAALTEERDKLRTLAQGWSPVTGEPND